MFIAKIKAMLLHGLISALVALLASILVFYVWYPDGIAGLTGGTGLYLLMLGVEVALGPLMSLVIYNPNKLRSELVRDYSVIGLVQISALVYGLYTVSLSRPVFLVFVKDRIEVIAATELDKEDLQQAPDDFKALPWLGPRLICVEYPEDMEERTELLWSALEQGKDIQLQPKYYRECREGEMLEAAYNKSQLSELTAIDVADLPQSIENDEFHWLPLVSRFGAWIAVYPGGSTQRSVYVEQDPFAKSE
ncbi:MAG: TfpX/TfpZ family type IV pilin accessory protein [Pseudomonadota bacterium]|nr:TfpX/TfpZ family type IV pilin accessory protein [Pseudomonadota bacterium]